MANVCHNLSANSSLSCYRNSEREYNFTPTAPKVARNCEHCGHSYQMGGPIWSQPIHCQQFISQLQKELSDSIDNTFGTHKRIHGLLQVLSEELIDSPLYYCLDRLCRVVQCSMPSMKTFRSALLNGGFQVSYSHASKTSVKTNAPNDFVWDVMREIQKKSQKNNLNEKSPGFQILSKKAIHSICFDIHENAEPLSKEMNFLRYQVNPEPDWGPRSLPSKMDDKRIRNQGKRSRSKDSSDLTTHKKFESINE